MMGSITQKNKTGSTEDQLRRGTKTTKIGQSGKSELVSPVRLRVSLKKTPGLEEAQVHPFTGFLRAVSWAMQAQQQTQIESTQWN